MKLTVCRLSCEELGARCGGDVTPSNRDGPGGGGVQRADYVEQGWSCHSPKGPGLRRTPVRHVQVHPVQRPYLYGADLVVLGDSDKVNQPSTLRSPLFQNAPASHRTGADHCTTRLADVCPCCRGRLHSSGLARLGGIPDICLILSNCVSFSFDLRASASTPARRNQTPARRNEALTRQNETHLSRPPQREGAYRNAKRPTRRGDPVRGQSLLSGLASCALLCSGGGLLWGKG